MKIRVVALCVFQNNGKLLVEEINHPDLGSYYRPIGGTVEYGEKSNVAIHRELKEELGVEVSNLILIGVLENIFQINGQVGHEIDFIYFGEFKERNKSYNG